MLSALKNHDIVLSQNLEMQYLRKSGNPDHSCAQLLCMNGDVLKSYILKKPFASVKL